MNLRQRITDICLSNGGVTWPMVDRLEALDDLDRILMPLVFMLQEDAPRQSPREAVDAAKAKVKILIGKAVAETLDRLERNGHGGGNWRRLIELERSKLNGEPERE